MFPCRQFQRLHSSLWQTQADLIVPREAVAAIGNSYRWIRLDLTRRPNFASQLAPRPNITQHAFFSLRC